MQGSEIKEEAIIKTVMFQKVNINRIKKIQYDILKDLFKYIVGKHWHWSLLIGREGDHTTVTRVP